MKSRQFANPTKILEEIQLKMSTLSELPTGKYDVKLSKQFENPT